MYMIYNNNSATLTLGNIAQSSSRSTFEGEETYRRIAKRRFALHRLESRLLPDEKGLQSCCLHAAPHAYIQGNVVPDTQSAFFGGLKHCDSPNCILCASRRADEARRELVVMLAECQRRGYFVYHLTFTMSHGFNDSLAWEHETLQGALADTFSDRWFMNFKKYTGYVGRVRGFENPFGENGWHLHAHIILILEYEALPSDLELVVFERYKRMLRGRGATASAEHGLKVEVGYSSLADYVCKFGHDPVLQEAGLENEMTDFRLKKGKRGSLTPFELLAAASGENEPLQKLVNVCGGRYSEAQCVGLAAELFVENFEAMKGKPRLVWATDLRDKLDMVAALDWYESIQPQPELQTWFELEPETGWKSVRGNGKEFPDLRGELLTELKSADYDRVVKWLRMHDIRAILYPDRDGGKSGKSEYI